MGLQPRAPKARGDGHPDIEKTPLDVENAPFSSTDSPDSDDADKPPRHRHHRRRRPRAKHRRLALLLPLLVAGAYLYGLSAFPFPSPSPDPLPPFVVEGMRQCALIKRPPPNPHDASAKRTVSDRFVQGTAPVYLKNATVWTGQDDGNEILYGAHIWLEGGVIRRIGRKEADFEDLLATGLDKIVDKIELDGAWITPGIVDLHSHLAVDPSPALEGSDSTNSWKAPIQPWLRSLDGFNTHDAAFNLSIAGGITTMLVLPGSAGNIGGQAFTFKPRWTDENTPQSMQVEPPFVIADKGDGTYKWERTDAWRHIKHACGENPLRVYGNTRMDSAYDFRRGYTEGKKLKDQQDRWCESPTTQTEPFPQSLEWEALADVIRGNVKVNIHCYETVDLNDMVRISNEFEFPIAAFHHAHEAFLVPELLKQTWGPDTPAVAIFANNARYKREAYRGTPYAPKILADAGLKVSMKSDHPVLDSRYLVYEAAQAHAFGLNFSHALNAVTTHSARTMGLGHRLGYIRPGYDADVVVWDSFPLSLGATPKQTYIDGIPQILKSYVVAKPPAAQKVTSAGDYTEEAAQAVTSRGDPDLRPKARSKRVVFEGVRNMYLHGFASIGQDEPGRVVVDNGEISCVGNDCVITEDTDIQVIDLEGGSLAPGIITAGSHLGVIEIAQEEMTADGSPYDLTKDSQLLGGLLAHGADGAQFGAKDQLFAYQAGVTVGVTPPLTDKLFAGYSYSYSTRAEHALEQGAICNSAAALHLNMNNGDISVSTKFALLRRLLRGGGVRYGSEELNTAFARVANGGLRLVVHTNSADHIAALVRLKREVAPMLKVTVLGGHESWMVADDLASESIGVIVSPARSFPADWSQRRILPGPPLSHHTLPSYLASRGVKVGLGIVEECDARLTRFDAAWAYAAAPGVFSKQMAIDLVSSNLAELLGLGDSQFGGGNPSEPVDTGFVAYQGDMFSLSGRVRAVRAPGAEIIDLF